MRTRQLALPIALALVAVLACGEDAPTTPESLAGDDSGTRPVDGVGLLIDLPVNQSVTTTAPAYGFRINQLGTGPVAAFEASSLTHAQTALLVNTRGLGRGAWFRVQNAASASPGVDVRHIGTGFGLQSVMAGRGGAGSFENTSASSVRAALSVSTASTEQPAARIFSTNASGRFAALFAYHPGYTALRAFGGGTSGSYPVVSIEQEYGSTQFGTVAALEVTGAGSPRVAALFNGNVHVSGTLSKLAGSFRIDHPLDPDRKYLSHSFVESPDMMNVYNGNAVLDEHGRATVELPAYFEALNRDFRYQLTAVGAPGPNLYIAEGVKQNRFQVAGGRPYAHVSWQVTGVRQDTYAREHPIRVEEDKAQPVGDARDVVARR